MQIIKDFLNKIKRSFGNGISSFRSFSLRRKIFFLVVFVLILLMIFKNGGTNGTDIVKAEIGVLEKTVEATGVVTSNVDLEMSFRNSGEVRGVYKKVGEEVFRGQIIAELVSAKERADVTEALGNLRVAEAELSVGLNEEIEIAEINLENTIQENELAVENAYKTLLSDDLEAIPEDGPTGEIAPVISGNYNGNVETSYLIKLYSSSAGETGASFEVTEGPESDVGERGTVSINSKTQIGESGLFIQFDEDFRVGTEWRIDIPNKSSSSYTANKNAYDLAVQNKENNIKDAEANLALVKAQNSSTSSSLAEAKVLQARGRYESAVAVLEDSIIRAPADGILTRIDVKVGESVEALESVVSINDKEGFYIESKVNENNVLDVKQGLSAKVYFDANPDSVYEAEVLSVDIAPQISNDIVNYKVLITLKDTEQEIIPGLSARVEILVFREDMVVKIPKRVVRYDEEGEAHVTLEDNKKEAKRKIVLGRTGDGAFVEVTSGLVGGEEILIK